MLLGFKPRFVDPIQDGTKFFTMRNPRKVTPKIGEVLHMYTGLRTKWCKLITKQHTLKCIQQAVIRVSRGNKPAPHIRTLTSIKIEISVDGRVLNSNEISQFVKYDGFENCQDFAAYWLAEKKVVTVTLDLFHWTDLKY